MWNTVSTDEEAESEAKYRFIRHYANRSNFPTEAAEKPVNHHSSKVTDHSDFDEYTFALDGQQRLTSFLIGLCGSFYEHRYRKHTDNLSSYYEKFLCLNLLEDPNREPDDAQEYIFDFEFRREGRHGHYPESNEYWWPVYKAWNSDIEILTENIDLPTECLVDGDAPENVEANLSRLQRAITAEQIPCEEVSGMRSEEALELFIRRNKGGEELSNSDIAFSLITVYWDEFDEDEDPKEIFENQAAEFTSEFGKYSFGFGKGFLIRALLYLNDEKPSFERDNLVPDTIEPLENYWGDQFFEAIKMTFTLVTKELGLTDKCLGRKTSLLPLLYYCWDGIEENELDTVEDIPEADRDRMEYWIQLTVLNDILNITSSMTVLDNVRPLVRDNPSFPISDIVDRYQGGSVTIGVVNGDEEEEEGVTVSELVNETDHSSETTLRNYLLTKLYEDRGVGEDLETEGGDVTSIEVDHFFPASKLRNNENYLDNRDYGLSDEELAEMKSFCSSNVNRFGNFTLLPHGAGGNQSKGEKDPGDWLANFDARERAKEIDIHNLPEMSSYTYDNYQEFLQRREDSVTDELRDWLILADQL
jgi:hypothetical protein